jgi:YHS domain-containing protein
MAVRDPVCGMEIEPSAAAETREFGGKTFYFCSASCAERFDEEPEVYAGSPGGGPGHGVHGGHAGHGEHGGHGGHGHRNHHAHHARMVADFRRRFWVSLALTVPILLLSP